MLFILILNFDIFQEMSKIGTLFLCLYLSGWLRTRRGFCSRHSSKDGTDWSRDGTEWSGDRTDWSKDGREGSKDGREESRDGAEWFEDGKEGYRDGTDWSRDGAEWFEDRTDWSQMWRVKCPRRFPINWTLTSISWKIQNLYIYENQLTGQHILRKVSVKPISNCCIEEVW